MLEKSLRILFETKNVSLVKRYVQSQMCKIASGRISLQELTFAREFRGLHGYRPGACVPALELTRYNLHNIIRRYVQLIKNTFPTKLFIYLSIF